MRKKSQPKPVSEVLESFLKSKGYLSVCKDYELINKWPDIVGQEIAEATVCTRVEQGIAYVRVKSAPWRQELIYLKDKIIKKINASITGIILKEIIFY